MRIFLWTIVVMECFAIIINLRDLGWKQFPLPGRHRDVSVISIMISIGIALWAAWLLK
jgi:hypothetical protein